MEKRPDEDEISQDASALNETHDNTPEGTKGYILNSSFEVISAWLFSFGIMMQFLI